MLLCWDRLQQRPAINMGSRSACLLLLLLLLLL
jgi:hypothetical protein